MKVEISPAEAKAIIESASHNDDGDWKIVRALAKKAGLAWEFEDIGDTPEGGFWATMRPRSNQRIGTHED